MDAPPAGGRPTLSPGLPIYQEGEGIPQLHKRLQEFLTQLALPAEVVFVNDGSRDKSMELLRGIAAEEPRYRVVSFARNFGYQRAITAGVDYARGEAGGGVGAERAGPPEGVL